MTRLRALPALLWLGLAQSTMAQDMPGMDMGAKPSGWQIHSHTTLTLAGDHQEGPRGGDKTFVEGMTMLMARHSLGDHSEIELQAMFSPDPFMGKRGYPLLLQTGETADGATPLVDRQHPHDLFMGLSATMTRHFDSGGKAFITVGYPAESAFGPTAFMHRPSGQNFPTAPISHHWLDSGHITMGVVTAGLEVNSIKLEVSQFTGREPDERRFNLDPLRLDSTAMRLSWAITPELTAQASWARQISPEALEPDVDLIKQSLSFAWSHDFGDVGALDSTLAFGRKQVEHGASKPSDAWLFENTWRFNDQWASLARFERVHNDELAPGSYWVARTELGVMRTLVFNADASLNLGVVRQFNNVPDALKPAYGAHPDGTVAFLTLKLHAMKM